MAFREGLEALLIIIIISKFLNQTKNYHLKKYVHFGFIASILFSIIFGWLLFFVANTYWSHDHVGKIWESSASILAASLIVSLIIWMIKNGENIKQSVEQQTAVKLSEIGIFLLTLVLIAREGVEIVMFTFAGDYPVWSIIIGLFLAIILAAAILLSLFKLNLKIIFNLTLIYLIIQTGYLFGYGVHEGLEALEGLGYVAEESWLMSKVFDLSSGLLNHKEGLLGLPLHILFGWYSKPEWLQFLTQYLVTIYLSILFYKQNKKQSR